MRPRAISVALAVLLFTSGLLAVTPQPAGAATCPCSIWAAGATPAVISDSDTDSVELGLKFRADTNGTITGVRFYKGPANTGTHVGRLWSSTGTPLASVTFTGETASGWQQASFPTPVGVTAGQTYVVSYLAPNGRYSANNDYFAGQGVSNTPLQALASGVDGLNGVYQYGPGGFPTNSYRDSNYWVDVVFSLTSDPPPPPPPPAEGPGGPVLVIAADGFGRYLGDILQAEGLNSYRVVDLSTLNATLLAAYDVAILGPSVLSAAQVTTVSNWVTGGGNLVAMKPDKKLAGLLGLSTTTGTLAEGYLKVDTSAAPGTGIVADTMQFHGTADRYGLLAGTRQIAALYQTATAAAGNPAVSLRNVGSAGGQAAAFTYDLARSVVYTRQGNPAWAGRERDGSGPIRSNDLFWGPAPADPQTDWVNPAKIAIPQADEQQRLLVNLIESMNLDRKPLPRFWYLPRGAKAAVVMTGDDHGNGGTIPRFNEAIAASPPGCNVANWECIRATSYVFPGTPITDAQASGFTNAGFEVALHVDTSCGNYTAASLAGNISTQGAALANQLPSNPPSVTNRTHCIAWSDWATQPTVEAANGIRLDTTYYYWPAAWAATNPGLFTGSGLPMRFANLDGSRIDVYQAATQMTDESDQAYPATLNALLDRALGTDGFYGAFTANIHTDNTSTSPQSNAIIAAAKARGVPVISARQLLTWLDGRNSSSFGNLAWSNNALTFNLTAGSGSIGLQALLPLRSSTGTVLTALTRDGATVPFTTQTIKGVQYGVFAAGAGAWRASFGVAGPADTTPPSVTGRTPAPAATNVARSTNVTATFNEPIDPDGLTFTVTGAGAVAGAVTYDAPTRTATFNPTADLAASTLQNISVRARDVAGNLMPTASTWSFTTAATVCPCSIWPPNATPASPSDSDTASVELGLKFRPTVNGTITGVRFYKGSGNTGTHVGSLWSRTGTLLGRVTFTNETASGWQTATFAAPLAVTANTTYVVSYLAPNGRYAGDNNFFAGSGVSNPPLQALADGVDGANSVYRYGTTSEFPTSSYRSSNYWVDVIFN